jgi:hypothetical protein
LRATVEEAMQKGLFRPELSDPELTSQTIWAAVHGVAALEIAFGCGHDWVDWRPLRERQERMLDAILFAVLKDPSRYIEKGG